MLFCSSFCGPALRHFIPSVHPATGTAEFSIFSSFLIFRNIRHVFFALFWSVQLMEKGEVLAQKSSVKSRAKFIAFAHRLCIRHFNWHIFALFYPNRLLKVCFSSPLAMFVILFNASAGKTLPALNANEKAGIRVPLSCQVCQKRGGKVESSPLSCF